MYDIASKNRFIIINSSQQDGLLNLNQILTVWCWMYLRILMLLYVIRLTKIIL